MCSCGVCLKCVLSVFVSCLCALLRVCIRAVLLLSLLLCVVVVCGFVCVDLFALGCCLFSFVYVCLVGVCLKCLVCV